MHIYRPVPTVDVTDTPAHRADVQRQLARVVFNAPEPLVAYVVQRLVLVAIVVLLLVYGLHGCALHPVPTVQCAPGQSGDVAYGDAGYAHCAPDPTAYPPSQTDGVRRPGRRVPAVRR